MEFNLIPLISEKLQRVDLIAELWVGSSIVGFKDKYA